MDLLYQPIRDPLKAAKSLRIAKCFTYARAARSESPEKPAFAYFCRLPPELRVYIWQLYGKAVTQPPHPLRVRLYRGHERISRSSKKTIHKATLRLTAMPDLGSATMSRRAMLRICRDARYEFLRQWQSVLLLDRGGLLRFDRDKDVIFLDIRNTRVIEDLVQMRTIGICPDFAKAIGHIGFEMVPRLPHWSFNSRPWLDPRLDFILCFPNLHSISLISFDMFDSDVDWDNEASVALFLSRSRSHYVKFRGFPVLEGVDYKKQSVVGTRTGGGTEKHECVICTIHKCVYVRDFLRNVDVNIVDRPLLTDEENQWLAGLSYHTLLASTPRMAECIKPFRGCLSPAEQAEEDDEEFAEIDYRDTEDDDDMDDDEPGEGGDGEFGAQFLY